MGCTLCTAHLGLSHIIATLLQENLFAEIISPC